MFYAIDCTGSDYIKFILDETAIEKAKDEIDEACFGDNAWIGKKTSNNGFNCEISESQWNNGDQEDVKKVFSESAIDFISDIMDNMYQF